MASKHAATHDRKAASEESAELITKPEFGKAIVLGAVQGAGRKAGGGVVSLLLWWIRNVI